MRSVAAAGETPSPSPTCNSIFIPFCFASKTQLKFSQRTMLSIFCQCIHKLINIGVHRNVPEDGRKEGLV
jgi:hypothetical protein